jgi:V8-like Glu-specific endopeptidase
VVGTLLGGCAERTSLEEPLGSAEQAIKGGTPATGFPEAALVNVQQNGQNSMGCTGTVIAPRVVLTAAHCVADGDGWVVSMPYAQNQTAHGSSSAVYDWTNTNDQVTPDQHDVALVFLDSPINLTTYPTIATSELANGAQIVTLGRVKGGQLSKTTVYQSGANKVSTSPPYDFNFDYSSPMVLEAGDSGGASYAIGTHTIVAVNSTGDSSVQLIARVDLLADWIAQKVAAHGGGGGGGSNPGGGTGGSSGGGGEGGGDPNGGGFGGAGPGGGGEGGSDPGGDPGGQGNGPGGWPPGWPPGGGPGGGWPPGGGKHHCVFIPWMWSYYCW